MKDIEIIKKEVRDIKQKLAGEELEHFSIKDIINAFFGALIVGMTFVLKGLLIQVASVLTIEHIVAMIGLTFLFLTLEIYFIGYHRVINKKARPFGQFLAKRIVAIFIISIFVSFLLVYLYGINNLVSNVVVCKIAFALLMPCAIGAAIADLLKQF